MKKREIHWSNTAVPSNEPSAASVSNYTPPIVTKQLVMASGSLPLPTKAERKKAAKKKQVVFAQPQGNSSLKEIKKEHTVQQFVLAAKPGSLWKLGYNPRARAKHKVLSIYAHPDGRLEFLRADDKDFQQHSVFVFIKHISGRSVFMTASGRLFSFALDDNYVKRIVERMF